MTEPHIVEVLASNERNPVGIVDPDDLRDGNGTLRRALELWSCRNGPVQYNTWQSVFFAMIREHGIIDTEAVPDESKSERQLRTCRTVEPRKSLQFTLPEGKDRPRLAIRQIG